MQSGNFVVLAKSQGKVREFCGRSQGIFGVVNKITLTCSHPFSKAIAALIGSFCKNMSA